MKILVCGGAGFIGSNFIRYHLKNFENDQIVNLDNLSFGDNFYSLKSYENSKNYRFEKDDIRNPQTISRLVKNADIVVNFAAETHVDRSISNSKPFVEANILGVQVILEAITKYKKKFLQVSTDEVYGTAYKKKTFSETDVLNPTNPYSATKAGADLLTLSYHMTYGSYCMISRCSNNFGPYQFPEKLIPKTIIRAYKNLKIPIYGDGNQTRDWMYVLDHVTAIESILSKGRSGEIYNISTMKEVSNLNIVKKILKFMNKSQDLIEFVDDRPGHDRRYSLSYSKIERELKWAPNYDFDSALNQTIDWYLNNKNWWHIIANKKSLHKKPWIVKSKIK